MKGYWIFLNGLIKAINDNMSALKHLQSKKAFPETEAAVHV